jgi:hypothetical protein
MDARERAFSTGMKLEELGNDARIWVFGTPANLDRRHVEQELDTFVGQWKAHGKPLAAAYETLHDRFVVVGMDPNVDPSGCSIDKLFGLVENLDPKLLDSDRIYYRRTDGEIASAARAEFREMVARGEVGVGTRVFDLTVERLRDLRSRFEVPAGEAWHAKAFGLAEARG